MFLFVGTFLLSLSLIAVLHIYIFKKVHPIISKIIIAFIGIGSIFTLTVHGIWLGLTILILGFLWLKNYQPKREV